MQSYNFARVLVTHLVSLTLQDGQTDRGTVCDKTALKKVFGTERDTLQRGVTSTARHSENATCRGVTSTARHAALSHSFDYISTTKGKNVIGM